MKLNIWLVFTIVALIIVFLQVCYLALSTLNRIEQSNLDIVKKVTSIQESLEDVHFMSEEVVE